MSVRVADVVASLQSADGRIVSAAAEALAKGMQTDGFNRMQNAQGVRIHRDKSTFPSSCLPLVLCLLRLLGGGADSPSVVDPATVRHASLILQLMVRASRAFARWVYTVPKFVSIYLRVFRASVSADQDLALRLLKTLQHIVALDKKACLVIRLEGGIKTIMQCSGTGSSGGSSSSATTGRATASSASHSAADAGSVSALSAALSAASLHNSAPSAHSSMHQKILRVLLEILLLVLKSNEHNSTAIVAQALPHLSNLLHVLRTQQTQVRIFSAALQCTEKLCKEKRIAQALMGTMPAIEDASVLTGSAVPAVPPPSAAVLSLLSALGPGTSSFMTWCMATLLTSKSDVLNVLLRLIFQLAATRVGFVTLLANGGVDALMPVLHTQLHKTPTVRAVCALIWQQQKQQFGHLIPTLDPIYKFDQAGAKVYFTKDGRVLLEAQWEAEKIISRQQRAAAAAAAAAAASQPGASSIPASAVSAEDDADLEADGGVQAEEADADEDGVAPAAEADNADDDAPAALVVVSRTPQPAAAVAASSAALPISFVHEQDDSQPQASDDDDDAVASTAAASGLSRDVPLNSDAEEDDDEPAGSEPSSDAEAAAGDSGDEAQFKKKHAAAPAAPKKSIDAPAFSALMPSPPLTAHELEKAKTLLLQAVATASASMQPPVAEGAAPADPFDAAATHAALQPPRLGLEQDDATFASDFSPELWDPDAPETHARMHAAQADVTSSKWNVKSLTPFVLQLPFPSFTDAQGRLAPGIAPSSRADPLADPNPAVLLDKMREATRRFVHPHSFTGRVVYDKDAGGSLLHVPHQPSAAAAPISADADGSASDSSLSPMTFPSAPSPAPTLAAAATHSTSSSPTLASRSRLSVGSTGAGRSSSPMVSASPSSSPKATIRQPALKPKSVLSLDGSKKPLSAKRTAGAAAAAPAAGPALKVQGVGSKSASSPAASRRTSLPLGKAIKLSTPAVTAAAAAASKPSSASSGSKPAAATHAHSATPSPPAASPAAAPSPSPSSSSGASSVHHIPPLHFESRFESGNLHRAVQVSACEYDLVLSTDVNSRGYTQWFFFQIKGMTPNVRYKFNILNLEKNHSTFNTGMKPVWLSARAHAESGQGWARATVEEVAYFHSYHQRPYDDRASRLKVTGGGELPDDIDDEEDGADNADPAASAAQIDVGEEDAAAADQEAASSASSKKVPRKAVSKSAGVKRPLKKSVKKAAPTASLAPAASTPASGASSRAHSPAGGRAVTAAQRMVHSPLPGVAPPASHLTRSSSGAESAAADASGSATPQDLAASPSATPLPPDDSSPQSRARALDSAASSEAPARSGGVLVELDMSPVVAPKKRMLKKKTTTGKAASGKLSARGSAVADGAAAQDKDGTTPPPALKKKRKVVSSKKPKAKGPDCFYTLTFSIKFPHADDSVLLAYHYPFTYSFQRHVLDQLQSSSALANQVMRRQRLTVTRGGNLVELLTITDFPRVAADLPAVRSRRLVVLSARIHPGESNASWVMKGLIDFLVGPSVEAQTLRSMCVFKIIPMLNADGVVEGNYRASLSGVDLNRHWDAPSPSIHPTIFAARRLLLSCSVQRSLLLFCDFHGHSAMKNSCLYGCDSASAKGVDATLQPQPIALQTHFKHIQDALTMASNTATSSLSSSSSAKLKSSPSLEDTAAAAAATSKRSTPLDPPLADPLSSSALASSSNPLLRFPPSLSLSARATLAAPLLLDHAHAASVFPELLARKIGQQYFSLGSCAYSVRREKAGTARVVFWRALRHSDVFTFEASFAGGTLGDMKGMHFAPHHYEDMGARFAETIRELHKVRKEKQQATIQAAMAENARATLAASAGAAAGAAGPSSSF